MWLFGCNEVLFASYEYRENALDLIILSQVALEKRHTIFVLL